MEVKGMKTCTLGLKETDMVRLSNILNKGEFIYTDYDYLKEAVEQAKAVAIPVYFINVYTATLHPVFDMPEHYRIEKRCIETVPFMKSEDALDFLETRMYDKYHIKESKIIYGSELLVTWNNRMRNYHTTGYFINDLNDYGEGTIIAIEFMPAATQSTWRQVDVSDQVTFDE